ncbi:hypothetical protein RchiOBHm_Chr1g0320371 [Rosa chinensis]|uniref:Uncharacterized protein n=1 Tax=Rosa chinensis TaxID=74649 RepID=A0A2P6S8M6_ROSCH|nr:hypothetical protein RchiOBHm_Chr1g0320371 [Rosa chinensis]
MRLRQISTMRILFFLDRLNLPISINSSQGPGNLHLEAPSVSLHGHPTDFRSVVHHYWLLPCGLSKIFWYTGI